MDNIKIGQLIYRLRKEKNLTQAALAAKMNISDKTVSKWERGLGCPEVSLLPELSKIFEIDLENLLSGNLEDNDILGGNMKNLCFYLCPNCGNLISAITDTNVSCCGKKLKALQAQKPSELDDLTVEKSDNDLYISAKHPMTREHYISFVALLTGDGIILKKQYPEWDLSVHLPTHAHGKLLWYCTQDGLFYMNI